MSSSNNTGCVPIRTQVKCENKFDWSQYQNITKIPPIFLVYIPEKLTNTQQELMKRCLTLLQIEIHHSLVHLIRHVDQIKEVPEEQTNAFIVIPEEENIVIRKIRAKFGNTGKIYLPRAVIGALTHYRVQLPTRSLAISLAMHGCHIFLSIGCKCSSEKESRLKRIERSEISKRILELGGIVEPEWKKPKKPINVVITDNASNRHCIYAHNDDIPVVSRNWVDDTYRDEKSPDYTGTEAHINALDTADNYRVRPFYGLHFKIQISDPQMQKEAKTLIIDNQGQVVYGEENCLTHVVRQEMGAKIRLQQRHQTNNSEKKKDPVHYVGLDWLRKCADENRCIGTKDFRLMTQSIIKQERLSPICTMSEESFAPSQMTATTATPPKSLSSTSNDENNYDQTMLPPPLPPPSSLPQQPLKQQTPYGMSNAAILNSLLTDQQTAPISTQIRSLPDPEIQREQIYEPSQQLFWDDARKDKNCHDKNCHDKL